MTLRSWLKTLLFISCISLTIGGCFYSIDGSLVGGDASITTDSEIGDASATQSDISEQDMGLDSISD